MTADFLVVLDASVLVQAPLRDTLLRLAEQPRLYVPRWSEAIIAETVRNLERRIGLSSEKTAYLVGQLRNHFGDSWVTGYEPLIDRMADQQCSSEVSCLRAKFIEHDRWIESVLVFQKRARTLNLNVPGLGGGDSLLYPNNSSY